MRRPIMLVPALLIAGFAFPSDTEAHSLSDARARMVIWDSAARQSRALNQRPAVKVTFVYCARVTQHAFDCVMRFRSRQYYSTCLWRLRAQLRNMRSYELRPVQYLGEPRCNATMDIP